MEAHTLPPCNTALAGSACPRPRSLTPQPPKASLAGTGRGKRACERDREIPEYWSLQALFPQQNLERERPVTVRGAASYTSLPSLCGVPYIYPFFLCSGGRGAPRLAPAEAKRRLVETAPSRIVNGGTRPGAPCPSPASHRFPSSPAACRQGELARHHSPGSAARRGMICILFVRSFPPLHHQ